MTSVFFLSLGEQRKTKTNSIYSVRRHQRMKTIVCEWCLHCILQLSVTEKCHFFCCCECVWFAHLPALNWICLPINCKNNNKNSKFFWNLNVFGDARDNFNIYTSNSVFFSKVESQICMQNQIYANLICFSTLLNCWNGAAAKQWLIISSFTSWSYADTFDKSATRVKEKEEVGKKNLWKERRNCFLAKKTNENIRWSSIYNKHVVYSLIFFFSFLFFCFVMTPRDELVISLFYAQCNDHNVLAQ